MEPEAAPPGQRSQRRAKPPPGAFAWSTLSSQASAGQHDDEEMDDAMDEAWDGDDGDDEDALQYVDEDVIRAAAKSGGGGGGGNAAVSDLYDDGGEEDEEDEELYFEPEEDSDDEFRPQDESGLSDDDEGDEDEQQQQRRSRGAKGVSGRYTKPVDIPLETPHEQRLARAKLKQWAPPTGHGGLERPEVWREEGAERRRRQASAPRDLAQEDVEAEKDAITNLAEAFQLNSEAGLLSGWNDALQRQYPRDVEQEADMRPRRGRMREEEEEEEQEEEEAEEIDDYAFQQDLRGAAGFRRKRDKAKEKTRGRRQMKEQILSPETRQVLSQANMLYISEDIDGAIGKLQEVISLDATVRSAWATLAVCFGERGQEERSIQCRIIEAHLTAHPVSLWVDMAHRSRSLGFFEQADYCFSQAIKSTREKDKSDVIDIMWDRAMLLQDDMDQPKRAAHALLQLLKFRPHNQQVIKTLIPLLYQCDMIPRAIAVLQELEEWSMGAFADPGVDLRLLVDGTEEDIDGDVQNTYESSEVVTLADLLLYVGRAEDALMTIKRGARWLQGRLHEDFWEEVPDDREFDEVRGRPLFDGEPRPQGEFGRRIDMAPIHYLDPEMRFRLGICRSRMGDAREAKHHFEIWRRDADFLEQMDHFGELVDEYVQMGYAEDGLEIAEHIYNEKGRMMEVQQNPSLMNEQEAMVYIDIADYKRIAACFLALERSSDAIGWLEGVCVMDPGDLENKLRLAEALEDVGERERAIELVGEVVRAKRVREAQITAEAADAFRSDDHDRQQQQLTTGRGEEERTLESTLSFFAEVNADRDPSLRLGRKQTARTNKEGLTTEQRRELESIREGEADLAWRRMRHRQEDVFVDHWWSADVPFSGDAKVDLFGSLETPSERQKRFDSVADWLEHAETLVVMFLETPQLYPSDRLKKFTGVFKDRRGRGRGRGRGGRGGRGRDRGGKHPQIMERGKNRPGTLDGQARALLSRMGDDMLGGKQLAADLFRKEIEEHSSFRGIDFDDWLLILLQYAMVQTKMGNYQRAKDTLTKAFTASVVWSRDDRKLRINLGLLACAMHHGDAGTVFEEVRHVNNFFQFDPELPRIINTFANAMGGYGAAAYQDNRYLKSYLRRARIHEAIVQGVASKFRNNRWAIQGQLFESNELGNIRKARKRGARADDDSDPAEGAEEENEEADGEPDEEDDQDEDDDLEGKAAGQDSGQNGIAKEESAAMVWKRIERTLSDWERKQLQPPTQYSPHNDILYASMILTSSSGIPSMAYWLRVFAHVQSDALVCLGASIACLGRAMNRQVDNRHQCIVQAMALLSHYRKIRLDRQKATSDGTPSAEAEYNFGRALQQLGLYFLAVPHYTKALELHDQGVAQRQQDEEANGFDPHKEAAFNLALIYSVEGNKTMAAQLFDRYLAIH
ncbi:TPR-like protein [Acaromyces ingoldii]|uniref:TPR-like protein n=1 Tax=Acaromyces ingoldii TaxID=215250 RepID=A0A316YYE1_9BASI|nr:TPR-like protein [Acaromyces ingoldii]PWN94201.1 TPR-like protein [Acaromyces ingoldii]